MMTEKTQPQKTSPEATNPFLTTGSHIGTVYKTGDMKRYIFKRRKDGLLVLNVENIEERLKIAAEFIAQFPADRVVIVARRLYGQLPARKFAEIIGAKALTGRFIPGTFSNKEHKKFIEPKVVLVTEPEADLQAIKEASIVRAPVVAFVSTNNSLRNVDLAIPMNNKGRKSLALAFYTLTREYLVKHKDIKNVDGFSLSPEDFEYKLATPTGEEDPVKQAIIEGRQLRRKRFGGHGRGKDDGDRPRMGRKGP